MTTYTQKDNLDIVLTGLRQYGGPQKQAGSWHMVRCPFHDDTDPSLGIYVAESTGKREQFSFNCLGCGEHGHWNVFAEKTGLPTIQAWANDSNGSVAKNIVTADTDNELLGDAGITFKEVKRKMGCTEAQRWPISLEWRGYKGQLVHDVGGHIIEDYHNDSIAVLFPVKIAGKVRGGVKAIFEKQDGQKGKLGYITMRGEWVKSYGLFPYVYTKNLLRRTGYKFVIVVEGPRDALRLLSHGIPALALLGARTSNRTKALFVLSLGITHIYAMTDGDSGGDVTWNTIKSIFDTTKVSLKRIRIPPSSSGKEYDPGNMPESYIRKLKALLNDKHDFI